MTRKSKWMRRSEQGGAVRIIGACVAGLLHSMEELKRDIVASHDEDCLCQFCMDAFYFG